MFSIHNRLPPPHTTPYYTDFRLDNIHCYVSKATTKTLSALHIHDCAQLWYTLYDSCEIGMNKTAYTLKPGKFLVIPPYTPHSVDTRMADHVVFYSCEFTRGFVSDLVPNLQNSDFFDTMYLKPLYSNATLITPYLSFDEKTTEKVEMLLHELYNEFQSVDEFSLAHLRILFLKLFTILLEEYEKLEPTGENIIYSKYRASIKNALDFIDAYYTQDIRLKDVCKVAMMSTTLFSTIFRQITGQPFAKYINYLRMCRAKSLLRDTDIPLTNISMDCGFYDAAYFSKMFKQTFGITPSVYRKTELSDSV